MSLDLLQSIFSLSNLWSVFLIVVFFGLTILVHEWGHFIVARRRGVKVERFSIGFGPKLVSRRGRDGVEYCISWLPFGGYVVLPQLADMGLIEGGTETDAARLRPLSYSTKMLVLVAGAGCNILFAFLLACVLWVAGQPTSAELNTTKIGTVVPTLTLPNGTTVPSPASQAGLEPGDIIRAIDGHAVSDWSDLQDALVMGAGRAADGRPKATLTVDRDGHLLHLTVYPRVAGEDHIRIIGITPAQTLVIGAVQPGKLGAKIGLQPGDRIVAYDGTTLRSLRQFVGFLNSHTGQDVRLQVVRGDRRLTLTLPPRPGRKDLDDLGIQRQPQLLIIHPDPFTEIGGQITMTFRVLLSLLNPRSNVSISQLMGPVGIASTIRTMAQRDIRLVVWFVILLNVQLAIFNLLPIPLFDGGHMLFATIGRLRGRALPAEFVMTTQSVFVVLILSLFVYVTYNDFRRIGQDAQPQSPPPAAANTNPATSSP